MAYTIEKIYFPGQQVREWTRSAEQITRSTKVSTIPRRLRKLNAMYLSDIAVDLPTEARERALRTIENLEG
jgi:hypothetical protein